MRRFLILIVVVAGCSAEPQNSPTDAAKKTENESVGYISGISMAHLAPVEIGMPYEEVCQALGGPGKAIQDETRLQELRAQSEDPNCQYFEWRDEDTRITLAFLGGKLQHHSEKLGE